MTCLYKDVEKAGRFYANSKAGALLELSPTYISSIRTNNALTIELWIKPDHQFAKNRTDEPHIITVDGGLYVTLQPDNTLSLQVNTDDPKYVCYMTLSSNKNVQ